MPQMWTEDITMTFQEKYKKEILPALMGELGVVNPMAAPKLVKIVLNCGIGREAGADRKVIEKMSLQLGIITGQKPQMTRAKRAISSFKLRAGDPVGLKVTLRGGRMHDFLTRIVSVALPRVRDFRGVPTRGFDGKGGYTMGIDEQTIFPELDYAMVDKTRGFEVTFVSSAESPAHTKRLLELFGMPFEKEMST